MESSDDYFETLKWGALMSDNIVKIKPEVLEAFARELFFKGGMNEEDSAFQAKSLVDTNLWGVDSHGVIRIPAYFTRVVKKAINPRPAIRVIKGSLGLEVMDGDDGSGFIVGREAMKRAIVLAEKYNIGAVGVVRSNHFGAAALYSRMAVEKGMVGIAMTNVKPLITAPGARIAVVGNNPFSIAIPTYGDFPFVMDMSLSKVAGGKLALAIKKKEKIPMDWATDAEGKPTDDPEKAFKGFLLPMGDHKGLGLAYAVDMLSGVITGAAFSHEIKSMYTDPDDPSLTGHMMIAINISAIIGREEMKSRMGKYYQILKNTPMWDRNKELYLPGELEYLKSIERKREGIPVPKTTFEELLELAREFEIKSPLEIIE